MFPPPLPTSPTARLVIEKLDENGLKRQTPESTTATNTIDLREAERVLSTNIYFSDLLRSLEFSLAFIYLSYTRLPTYLPFYLSINHGMKRGTLGD